MTMIPSKKNMNYKSLDELKFYGMFVSACLSEKQMKDLKEAWGRDGGFKVTPWWKYVLEHTKVSLDFATKR
jgi:hypothetical protein